MYARFITPPSPQWNKPTRTHWQIQPEKLRARLLDPVSTSWIIHQAGAIPIIKVIKQGWIKPHQNEAMVLGIKNRQYAWVREVEIYVKEQKWMLARSVMPRDTFKLQSHPNLTGNAPIGAALFSDPRVSRSSFELAQLYGCYPGLSASLFSPQTVWGRRSIFFINHAPLLLSEAFLPDFQKHLLQI